jgi:hypothetical protein
MCDDSGHVAGPAWQVAVAAAAGAGLEVMLALRSAQVVLETDRQSPIM